MFRVANRSKKSLSSGARAISLRPRKRKQVKARTTLSRPVAQVEKVTRARDGFAADRKVLRGGTERVAKAMRRKVAEKEKEFGHES
ncbi:hypothetical protein [Halorhodospira halophila]|uniref:hypothetical protein n=1 Tax=Halorhodospira halophila TaxID=1053 RepID=UPI0005A277DA|nr:hypothetical protein [Halorhodospira halophila]MBK1728760.1 hypothetical protein [Halorhodospira halophila]